MVQPSFTVVGISSDSWIGFGLVWFQNSNLLLLSPSKKLDNPKYRQHRQQGKKRDRTNPEKVVFEVQGCRQYSNLSLLHSPKVNSVLCNTTCPSEDVTSVIIFAWQHGNPTQKDYFMSALLCSVLQLYTLLHWRL